ncbi:hypothetical protein KKF84_20995 [Myxococcota bacterium]|nr:hypothetical protein [Myxococcota bacterium]MBU1537803.1 hypothetical protein [Myxococcota bacterium]
MNTLLIIHMFLFTNPQAYQSAPRAPEPSARCSAPVTVYVIESGCAVKPAPTKYGRLPRASYLGPRSTSQRPARQITRDPGENRATAATVPEAPQFLKNKHLPGIDYGSHTSTLFPTAVTMEKGHTYYDFQFLGMYSGVQYGVSENLELGVKVVVPFAIATAIEHDLLEPFLKYGVHFSAKYRIYKGENLHLSARLTLPVPSAEVIGTLVLGRFDFTGALGVMVPLDSDVQMTWARATVRWKISPEIHLFGEYSQMKIFSNGMDDSALTMAVVALRRIKGRFSYDLGFGSVRVGEKNDDYSSNVDLPILYVNFGYAL